MFEYFLAELMIIFFFFAFDKVTVSVMAINYGLFTLFWRYAGFDF